MDSVIFPPSASAPAAPEPAPATNVAPDAAPDSASDASPLTTGELAALIDAYCPLPAGAPVAVAVSGGGDSMALTLLADAWARAQNRALRAVTVDHGLRAESRGEAERIGAWLRGRGVAHDILTWSGDKPSHGIQNAAREARYRLIGTWAREHGIAHVLVAHQLEDQAETFLMRLARGSGTLGLAAMRSVTQRNGIRICRPLLTVPRVRLRATLRAAGQEWIEDPSNDSPKFARPHYRRLVAALEARSAGAGPLADLAASFARLDGLMEVAARRALGAGAGRGPDGALALSRALFVSLPGPVAVRLLRDVLAEEGGRPHAPRSDRLARILARLTEPGRKEPISLTLGGCRIRAKRDKIEFRREIPRGKKPA